jgi:hypothetical protein
MRELRHLACTFAAAVAKLLRQQPQAKSNALEPSLPPASSAASANSARSPVPSTAASVLASLREPSPTPPDFKGPQGKELDDLADQLVKGMVQGLRQLPKDEGK